MSEDTSLPGKHEAAEEYYQDRKAVLAKMQEVAEQDQVCQDQRYDEHSGALQDGDQTIEE